MLKPGRWLGVPRSGPQAGRWALWVTRYQGGSACSPKRSRTGCGRQSRVLPGVGEPMCFRSDHRVWSRSQVSPLELHALG